MRWASVEASAEAASGRRSRIRHGRSGAARSTQEVRTEPGGLGRCGRIDELLGRNQAVAVIEPVELQLRSLIDESGTGHLQHQQAISGGWEEAFTAARQFAQTGRMHPSPAPAAQIKKGVPGSSVNHFVAHRAAFDVAVTAPP